jgi:regulator of sirC expression with transglutaminase-like and TPR domain
MSLTDIHALVQLLDDPDEHVFDAVQQAITERGEGVLHVLEDHYLLGEPNSLSSHRIGELITKIQYQSTFTSLKDWRESEQDLLEGILIINKYFQRHVAPEETTYLLSRIRQDVWLELNDRLTALENVNVLNHILFRLYGFSGVSSENSNAPHSVHDVLTTKTGTPLSLGTLYLLIARSLELPIYGVNVPGHFLLCYAERMPEWLVPEGESPEDEILFYINPFAGGSILDREEVEKFVVSQHLPLDARFFEPCSTSDVLTRTINALSHHFIALNDSDRVRELQVLMALLLEN